MNSDKLEEHDINSFKFEENIFNSNTEHPKKKKNKKSKGIDFVDYAKDKGIEIKLQYEDITPEQTYFKKEKPRKDVNKDNDKNFKKKEDPHPPKKEQKKIFTKPNTNSSNNNNNNNNSTNNNINSVSSNEDNNFYEMNHIFGQNTFNNLENNYSGFNDNNNEPKNNFNMNLANAMAQNQMNFNRQMGQNIQMMGNGKINKFDKMNQNYVQMPINPYQGKMFIQQQMPQDIYNYQAMLYRMNYLASLNQTQNFQLQQQQQQQQQQQLNFFKNYQTSDKEILDTLERQFSPFNLQYDINLREQMNEEGWVPVEFVLQLNKNKFQNVNIQRISSVLDRARSEVVEKNNW